LRKSFYCYIESKLNFSNPAINGQCKLKNNRKLLLTKVNASQPAIINLVYFTSIGLGTKLSG